MSDELPDEDLDIGDWADWGDVFSDEMPGLGRVKRAARFAKRLVSREYIKEIKK